MAWIERSRGLKLYLRLAILVAAGLFVMGVTYTATAEMQKLNRSEMEEVDGQGGIAFTLENFQISGNQKLFIAEDEFSSQGLTLMNLSLREPLSDPRADAGVGVTTGTLADPMSLDFAGTGNGFIVLELPENKSVLEPNRVTIGEWRFNQNTNSMGRIELRDAQYANGTRFSVGGYGTDGGIRTGLLIKLDASELSINTPNGGLNLGKIRGSANWTGDNWNSNTWDFTGPLRWAELTAGRPLVLDFFEENGNEKFFLEFNPSTTGFKGGTVGVGNMKIGDTTETYYGEAILEGVFIRNIQVKGPENIGSHSLSTY